MAKNASNCDYFSNPMINFKGVATGLAGYADNATTINQTIGGWAARRSPLFFRLDNPALSSDGSQFSMTAYGPSNSTITVEYTADYATWQVLGSYIFSPPSMVIQNTPVTGVQARFYRAYNNSGYFGSEVGFIKQVIPAGYSMVGNQLDAGDNSLGAIFPVAPEGTIISKWDESAQLLVDNRMLVGGWESPGMTLNPGEGVYVFGPIQFTNQFVGQVRDAFHIRDETQWCMRCSPVPQSGLITTTLRLPVGSSGDELYIMSDNALHFAIYASNGSAWSPFEPSLGLGQAFWTWREPNAWAWDRTFWTWP
jgi:hypothetical protein